MNRENIWCFLVWNNLGIALGCRRCVHVSSLLEVGWTEMKISALNQAEKESDLALAIQEASLLFSTCIHAHTIKMGTMKQFFFYGAVQSSICDTLMLVTNSGGHTLVRSASDTTLGKQKCWAFFSYPVPWCIRVLPCFSW